MCSRSITSYLMLLQCCSCCHIIRHCQQQSSPKRTATGANNAEISTLLHCPLVDADCVMPCAGEVVTDGVCQQRMQVAQQTGEPHFYMMELAPGLIIDARKKGNVARLINSSCAPNCESQKWHDAANGVLPAPCHKSARNILTFIAVTDVGCFIHDQQPVVYMQLMCSILELSTTDNAIWGWSCLYTLSVPAQTYTAEIDHSDVFITSSFSSAELPSIPAHSGTATPGHSDVLQTSTLVQAVTLRQLMSE